MKSKDLRGGDEHFMWISRATLVKISLTSLHLNDEITSTRSIMPQDDLKFLQSVVGCGIVVKDI